MAAPPLPAEHPETAPVGPARSQYRTRLRWLHLAGAEMRVRRKENNWSVNPENI